MKDKKKTEVITFRTDSETKDMLEFLSKENKWSKSQIVETLINNFISDPKPGYIVIKTEELKRVYDELIKSNALMAELEVAQITDNENENNEITYKGIRIIGLQCGGYGSIGGFEPIKALSAEEIKCL